LTFRHKTTSTRTPSVRRELVAPGLITVVVWLTTALSDFATRLGWCFCAERCAVLSATMVPITTVALRSCEPARLRPDCAGGLDPRQALRGDRLAAGFGGWIGRRTCRPPVQQCRIPTSRRRADKVDVTMVGSYRAWA